MTPYQRGNRDGLLSFAVTLDEIAEMWQADAKRLDTNIKKMPAPTEMQKMTVSNALFRAAAYREAASRARRAAEALPYDPDAFQSFENREAEQ